MKHTTLLGLVLVQSSIMGAALLRGLPIELAAKASLAIVAGSVIGYLIGIGLRHRFNLPLKVDQ